MSQTVFLYSLSMIFTFALFISQTAAQEVSGGRIKTVEVRGKKYQLEVDPNWIFVRPSAGTEEYDDIRGFATKAIQTQAEITKAGPEKIKTAVDNIKKMKQLVQIPTSRGRGILVPALTNDGQTDLIALTNGLQKLGDNVAEATPVFHYLIESTEPENKDKQKIKSLPQRVIPFGTVSIKYKDEEPDWAPIEKELGLKKIDAPYAGKSVVRFQVTSIDADPFAISDQLREIKNVTWSKADLVIELFQMGDSIPSDELLNDTHSNSQWYLAPGPEGIRIREAWARSTGKEEIVVAVLDDGVDTAHEDLPTPVKGYDFFKTPPDANPQPASTDSHGTACAGLIAALPNNNKGVTGLAWKAKIMPLRIAGPSSFAIDARIADAIHYAHDEGARILSCSWGGGLPSVDILDAIDEVTDPSSENPCLIFVAAGNARPALDVFFPASYDRCIAVGAVQKNNSRWNYSCYGPDLQVDLVAPSGDVNLQGDIWTTDHSASNGYNQGGMSSDADEPSGNYTGHFGGTSAATPIAAGVAALVWSTYPQLTAAQVRQVIQDSANKSIGGPLAGFNQQGRSKFYGFGKIDALGALEQAEILASTSSNTNNKLNSSSTNVAMCCVDNDQDPVQKLIDAVVQPKSAIIDIRGVEYRLTPDSKRITVIVNKESTNQNLKFIWNAIDPKKLTDGSLGTCIATLTDIEVYAVDKTALRSDDELKASAMDHRLPLVFPVYISKGELVYPLGTVIVTVKGSGRDDVLSHMRQSELKLAIEQPYGDNRIRLQLVPNKSFQDVFQVAEEIRKLPNVTDARAEIYTQRSK